MPGIPNVKVIVETVIAGRLDGQTTLNIFHWATEELTPDVSRAQATIMADNFKAMTAGALAFMNMFTTQWSIIQCYAQQIYPTRRARGVSAPAAPVDGMRAGTPLPTSVQWSSTSLTDKAGPGGHGGTRWPGAVVDDQANSKWTDAFLVDAADAIDFLFNPIVLNGQLWSPIVYNRLSPLLSEYVTSYILEDEVRTMRRRVVGRGI